MGGSQDGESLAALDAVASEAAAAKQPAGGSSPTSSAEEAALVAPLVTAVEDTTVQLLLAIQALSELGPKRMGTVLEQLTQTCAEEIATELITHL